MESFKMPGRLISGALHVERPGNGEPAATSRSMPGQLARMFSSGAWHSTMTVPPRSLTGAGIADELQRVAQPLLGMQQNRLAGQRRAVPAGLDESPGRETLALPTPFVFGKPAGQIAAAQPSTWPGKNARRAARDSVAGRFS